MPITLDKEPAVDGGHGIPSMSTQLTEYAQIAHDFIEKHPTKWSAHAPVANPDRYPHKGFDGNKTVYFIGGKIYAKSVIQPPPPFNPLAPARPAITSWYDCGHAPLFMPR
jgi:hypothetical protein